MIVVKDLNRQPIATLENVTEIGYEKITNDLWTASFSLPENDSDNEYIKPRHFIELHDDITNEYIGLFRVMPKETTINSSTEKVTYHLEHVLGLLIGSSLFKYHQLSNYDTRYILQYLIDRQHTKHWQLGRVDFTRYFHYSWENENILSALFSVPKPFNEEYRWTWDTQNYPFTLNLVKAETEPTAKIEEGYNLKGIRIEENPNNLYNRIYPLGSGEGVNQLGIEKVNNGLAYIENTASIDKHGRHDFIWVDRRFTDDSSLKETAERMLELWSEPIINWTIDAVDLSSLTGLEFDKLKEGKLIRISLDNYGDKNLRIVSEKKSDIYGYPDRINLQLENVGVDITDDIVEVQRKQQINDIYSQGATNILNYTFQDNCDNKQPARIPFYIDDDVVNVNTIELTFRTRRFRAYSGITEGGGSLVKSTSSGGSITRSTTSGGSVSKSTAGGGSTTRTSSSSGESTRTSSANGSHTHRMFSGIGFGGGTSEPDRLILRAANGHNIIAWGGSGAIDYHTAGAADNHSHTVTTPAHTHSVDIPSHTHGFEIPNHSHDVTIPNHNHEIDIPDHTHDIIHEIVEAPTSASSVLIEVDGNPVPHTSTSGNRINLAEYINKNEDGTVTRGRHEILITPNALARIEADVILRVFIRSQIGGVM